MPWRLTCIAGCARGSLCGAAALGRLAMIEHLGRRWCLLVMLACSMPVFAQSPALTWGPCPANSASSVSAAAMQCGWLNTGQRIDDKPVMLRVVVLRAHPDRWSQHPIIYVPGGPGDPAGLTAADLRQWRRFQQRAGWPADLVLFDPRGTGSSRPRPACTHEAVEEAAGHAACYAELGAATANALGPAAQIGDLQRLMAALPARRATLWAVSYGSVIAEGLAARAPTAVDALILDSPVVQIRSAARDQRAAERQAVAYLMRDCQQQLACRLAVPSLRYALAGWLHIAERRRPWVSWADVPYPSQALRLTPDRLLSMVMLAGYRADSLMATAQRLKQVARTGAARGLAPWAAMLGTAIENPGHGRVVYRSTRCAYQRGASSQSRPAEPSGAVPDWLVEATPRPAVDACNGWPVTSVSAPRLSALSVPTLTITGDRDPTASPRPAEHTTRGSGVSSTVVIRGAGHASTLSNRCAQAVVSRFLRRIEGVGHDSDESPDARASESPRRCAHSRPRLPRRAAKLAGG